MKKGQTFTEGLSEILVKNKVIPEQEARALQVSFQESSKAAFDDFLLEEGLIDEEDLLKALSQYYQVPAFDVVGYFFKTELLRKFPKNVLLSSAFIPLEVDENMLIVVASNPHDPELLEKIGEYVSYDVRFRVGLRRDIIDAVQEFYEKSVTEVEQDADSGEERQIQDEARRTTLEEEDVFLIEEEEESD